MPFLNRGGGDFVSMRQGHARRRRRRREATRWITLVGRVERVRLGAHRASSEWKRARSVRSTEWWWVRSGDLYVSRAAAEEALALALLDDSIGDPIVLWLGVAFPARPGELVRGSSSLSMRRRARGNYLKFEAEWLP